MSGLLFLLVVDWALRLTLQEGNTGIMWKFNSKLEDLPTIIDQATRSDQDR